MSKPEFQLSKLNPMAIEAILDYHREAATHGRNMTENEAAAEWVELKYDQWVRKQLKKMGYPCPKGWGSSRRRRK